MVVVAMVIVVMIINSAFSNCGEGDGSCGDSLVVAAMVVVVIVWWWWRW